MNPRKIIKRNAFKIHITKTAITKIKEIKDLHRTKALTICSIFIVYENLILFFEISSSFPLFSYIVAGNRWKPIMQIKKKNNAILC